MSGAVPLVIVGGGGHASDVLGAIEACNHRDRKMFEVIGYVDDTRPQNRRLERRGVVYLGSIEEGLPPHAVSVIAVGQPTTRLEIEARISARCEPAPPIVHPTASVGSLTSIRHGVVVLAGATISADVTIGAHVHISQLVAVGHDSILGDFSSVYPSAAIGGEVKIGEGVLVGSGAVMVQRLEIGNHSIIGAGATVVTDVPANVTAIGTPAKW